MTDQMDRRRFLRRAAGIGAAIAAPLALAACGSNSGGKSGATAVGAASATASGAAATAALASPAARTSGGAGSKEKIRLGFIPLTDCASIVMAQELGYFGRYGLNVEVVKEASWASVRDNLLNGELQGAHCLFGMPFSVYTGVGGQVGKELPIAMLLSNNGQGITLAKDFCGAVGYDELTKVGPAVDRFKAKKTLTFANTFPGGTHDLWLRYWLATANVDQNTVKLITIPPPQMVANMKVGNMDGFCVGEPWNGVAVKEGIGATHLATQDLWTNHPEKALVLNKEFSQSRRDDLKLVMKAVLEASAWLDVPDNRRKAADVIGRTGYVNASADVIDDRLLGKYELGCDAGQRTFTDDTMLFSRAGQLNFPRHSYAVWFMTQYVRFGLLKELPDVNKIASTLIMQDLYKEVAAELKLPLPDDDMAPIAIKLDGVTFDPADPAGYLKTAALKKAA